MKFSTTFETIFLFGVSSGVSYRKVYRSAIHDPHIWSHWQQPDQGGRRTGLKLANSLTGNADEFIPTQGNHVSWYICGPTVYDSSHVGHARNYMTFDIIRRIMVNYFRYDVLYVMNITDIDDKIILKSHQRHLQQLIRFIATQEKGKEFILNNSSEKEIVYEAKELVEAKKPTIQKLLDTTKELKEKLSGAGVNYYISFFF